MGGKQPSGDPLLIVLDENIASEDLQAALTRVALAVGAHREPIPGGAALWVGTAALWADAEGSQSAKPRLSLVGFAP